MNIKISNVDDTNNFDREFFYLLKEITSLDNKILLLSTLKATLKRAKLMQIDSKELVKQYNPKAPNRVIQYLDLSYINLLESPTKMKAVDKHTEVAIKAFNKEFDRSYPFKYGGIKC